MHLVPLALAGQLIVSKMPQVYIAKLRTIDVLKGLLPSANLMMAARRTHMIANATRQIVHHQMACFALPPRLFAFLIVTLELIAIVLS